MKYTELEVVLNIAISGIPNMLNDKAWPKTLRGFRMVVTLLLEESLLVVNTNIDQIVVLEQARKYSTCQMVDCLMIPVWLLISMFRLNERDITSCTDTD